MEKICKDNKINVKGQTYTKLDLVKVILQHNGKEPPAIPVLYNGNLSQVPTTISAISKLPVRKLRAILHHHGHLTCGQKEELVVRVCLLRHDNTRQMFKKDRDALLDLIKMCEDLIITQLQRDRITHHRRQRTYASVAPTTRNLKGNIIHSSEKATIELPPSVSSISDLPGVFRPLKEFC